jgi:methionine-rich copper-binding protein CopC
MRRARFLLAALLGLALHVAAHAHAFMDHADPKVGSVQRTAPAEVRIWFSEPLENVFSSIQVLDATGRRVDVGDARVDAQDRSLLRVRLATLAPGTYTVNWRVVSVDTHVTQGRFTFRVAS